MSPALAPAGIVTRTRSPCALPNGWKSMRVPMITRREDQQRDEPADARADRAPGPRGACGDVAGRGHDRPRRPRSDDAPHAADADRALGLVVERAGRRRGRCRRVGLDAHERRLLAAPARGAAACGRAVLAGIGRRELAAAAVGRVGATRRAAGVADGGSSVVRCVRRSRGSGLEAPAAGRAAGSPRAGPRARGGRARVARGCARSSVRRLGGYGSCRGWIRHERYPSLGSRRAASQPSSRCAAARESSDAVGAPGSRLAMSVVKRSS